MFLGIAFINNTTKSNSLLFKQFDGDNVYVLKLVVVIYMFCEFSRTDVNHYQIVFPLINMVMKIYFTL